jgi:hypothetical protein
MEKFTNYIINESLVELIEPKLEENNLIDINKKIIKMLEDTINSADVNIAKKFINNYLQDDEANYIIGFVNDSDVYDFYIKYIDVLDQILISNEHFTKTPNDLNVQSIYKYVIISTKIAVKQLLKDLVKYF